MTATGALYPGGYTSTFDRALWLAQREIDIARHYLANGWEIRG